MDLDKARAAMTEFLSKEFGKVCELREISVERSTTGRVFTGDIFCVIQYGDIFIGKVGVTEKGELTKAIGPDALIDALMAVQQDRLPEKELLETDFSMLDDDNDGLSELLVDNDGDDLNLFFAEFNSSDVMQRIIGLLTSGHHEDLLKARQLMPRLLVDHEKRGVVLMYMGELEIRLNEPALGLNYLEAAACEFADGGDIESLERTVTLATKALTESELAEHPITRLLHQTLNKLSPITHCCEAALFADLPSDQIQKIQKVAKRITVAPNQVVLQEGAPATQAFIIESGILGVSLETPGGSSRTIRCCFPGELVGESCIEGDGATCNATVYTKQECILYQFDGSDLTELVANIPIIKERLEASRTLHRLDSFFSMNEATNTLDVRVRDRLLGCISTIRHVDAQTIIEYQDAEPSGVYLVAKGTLSKHLKGGKIRQYGPDDFVALKETLHKLPMEGQLVADTQTQLVVFDPAALFDMAMGAPAEVTAVLDRLE